MLLHDLKWGECYKVSFEFDKHHELQWLAIDFFIKITQTLGSGMFLCTFLKWWNKLSLKPHVPLRYHDVKPYHWFHTYNKFKESYWQYKICIRF